MKLLTTLVDFRVTGSWFVKWHIAAFFKKIL